MTIHSGTNPKIHLLVKALTGTDGERLCALNCVNHVTQLNIPLTYELYRLNILHEGAYSRALLEADFVAAGRIVRLVLPIRDALTIADRINELLGKADA